MAVAIQTSKVPFSGCLCRKIKCSCTQQKNRQINNNYNFCPQINILTKHVLTWTKATFNNFCTPEACLRFFPKKLPFQKKRSFTGKFPKFCSERIHHLIEPRLVEFGRCTHRTSKIGDIGPCWNIGESASASRRCRCCKNRIRRWRDLRPQDDGA